MNGQNQAFTPSEPKAPWRVRHPGLFTALSCFVTGLIVFLVTFFSIMGHYRNEIEDYRAHYVKSSDKYDAGLLEAAIGLLDENSLYDLPDRRELTEAMIEAAIAAMGDRYGTFFTDAEYAAYSLDLSGGFVGIGVTVQQSDNGNARIVLVHDGSPAEESGLLAGDEITAVGDLRFADGYDEAFSALLGEAGTTVDLTVLRGGDEIAVTVTRADVVKQTVVRRIENYGGSKIGYVYISGFDGHTYEQFQAAVSYLETQGVDALLFDVRSNGGGLLSEVAKVLAYLLPDGVIAYVDYRSDALADYAITSQNGYVRMGAEPPELYCEGGHQVTVPVAVLTNGKTASAAELFTSALRDYATPAFDNALDVTIVGTTTYGKGVVQTTYPMSGSTALKMTIAHYDPPSHVNYDGEGIAPDEVVVLTAEQEKISVYLRTKENDPQLLAALVRLDQTVNP